MARDKESGDGYEYVPPDFDEDAFIHREMVAFKTTSTLFVWAIVAAAASWVAFVLLKGDTKAVWPAGLAICLAFGLTLKPLFGRITDISHFKRSNWVGTGLLFFFCWLAFFTVAVNPPVSDVSPPQVLVSADPPLQAAGGTVDIAFLATDNAGIPAYTMTLTRDDAALPNPPVDADANHPGHYAVKLANPTTQPGHYALTVTATDKRSHTTTAQANFTVQPGELLAVKPAGGNLTGTDQVLVTLDAKPCAPTPVPPCLRTVYFDPGSCNGQASCAVPFEYSDGLGGWYATARFAQWKAGANTGHVVAQFMDHFQGATRIPGGHLDSRDAMTFTVTPPASDLHTVSVSAQPPDHQVQLPGYGVLGSAFALLAVAAVTRRRT